MKAMRLCNSSKHDAAAQQTLYEQLLHEHRRQQQQQYEQQLQTVYEDEDLESDVIGDDVTSTQPFTPAATYMRKLSTVPCLH